MSAVIDEQKNLGRGSYYNMKMVIISINWKNLLNKFLQMNVIYLA